MSLIERAIDKLSGGDSREPNQNPAGTPKGIVSTAVTQQANASANAIDAAVNRHNAQLSNSEITRDASVSPRSNNSREAVRIHLEGMRLKGLLTPDVKQTATAEEFRVIKRPLLANAFGRGTAPVKNGKRIMVTSAFPGEGKSFCAINLAMSIAAERDNRVLLIDADVARPSIPRELGISAEVGLMDWLIDGKLDINDLVLDTNVDKLTILPAGRRHQQATELLASGSMSRLLEQISSRFPDRVCIFDSPPLLVTTEARVLASYMGQIVLVVEAGRTPRDQVTDALQTVASCDVVGLVLNKAKKIESNGYYGYGYGAA
jgi:protein-tyrosine kinase